MDGVYIFVPAKIRSGIIKDLNMENMKGPLNRGCRYIVYEEVTGNMVSQHFSLMSAEKTCAKFQRQDSKIKKKSSYYIWDDHKQIRLSDSQSINSKSKPRNRG